MTKSSETGHTLYCKNTGTCTAHGHTGISEYCEYCKYSEYIIISEGTLSQREQQLCYVLSGISIPSFTA